MPNDLQSLAAEIGKAPRTWSVTDSPDILPALPGAPMPFSVLTLNHQNVCPVRHGAFHLTYVNWIEWQIKGVVHYYLASGLSQASDKAHPLP